MVRLFAVLIGMFFTGWLLVSAGFGAYAYITEPPVKDVAYAMHEDPRDVSFPSDGILGRFDRAQLQRGLKVYKEVCAACHGLTYVSFRDLADLGYDDGQIKTLAAEFQVASINPDTGEAAMRPAIATDRIPSPYANEVAARAANGNALPPDLSLITKARANGAAYVHSLLTGYQNPPASLPAANRPGPGLYYNPWFAGLNIAMAAPLTTSGQVAYDDATPATVEQMSKDVSAFLIWTAEPKLEARKATGLWVMIFLIIGTVLAYMAYQQVWADQKPKKAPKPADNPA